VFVVVMENLDYSSAIATPGLKSLANRYASATSYYGVSHPSLPNYLALTSGSTWGVTSDCTDCFVNAPNLFSELAGARVSFAAYMEGIAGSCFLASYGGVDYAAKHDPFRYYDDVRSSKALCDHIEPYPRLTSLLSGPANRVPSFVWVTPNLCDDGHDCPATTAAAWLGRFIASVTKSPAWRDGGALFVTWDESDGDNSAVVPPGRVVPSGGGGHIMTLVVAPGLAPGRRVGVAYNHYSLLATVEDAFGLPLLGGARTALPMSAFFAKSVTPPTG
jgi:phospholipase C